MSEQRAVGTIYDLGYERYDGVRLGRANAIRTLLAFSFRAAFGIGRGGRAKVIPFLAMAFVFVPALIQVAMAATLASATAGMPGGAGPFGMFGTISFARGISSTVFLLALFAAAQAPELLVTDRQQRVLPLYLSRPLGATDYTLAKLGAFFAALLVLTLGPQLLLFAGKVMISETPWTALVEEKAQLWPILATTVLVSAFIASIALAIASLASRRAYATAGVMAFFLLLPAAARIGRSMLKGDTRRYAELADPMGMLTRLSNWLFDVQPAVAAFGNRPRRRPPAPVVEPLAGEVFLYAVLIVTAVALAVYFLRYRKVEV